MRFCSHVGVERRSKQEKGKLLTLKFLTTVFEVLIKNKNNVVENIGSFYGKDRQT